MMRSSIEPRRRKHVKRYELFPFATNLSRKYGKKLLNTATKTGLGAQKVDDDMSIQNEQK